MGDIIVAQYEGDIIKYNKDNQRKLLVKYSKTTLKRLRDITLDNIYYIDEKSTTKIIFWLTLFLPREKMIIYDQFLKKII